MRGKGPHRKRCQDAIREAVESLGIATAEKIHNWVTQEYPRVWSDDHIWQQIMASTVNLRPAHKHWPSTRKFLFMHEDGRYEIYNARFR